MKYLIPAGIYMGQWTPLSKWAGEQGAEEKGNKERRKRLSIAVEKQASLDMANETWRRS
jgi:hypothetical protein